MNNLRAETILWNVRCEKVFQGAHHFPELVGRDLPVHNSLPNLKAVLTKQTVIFNDKQFDQEHLSKLEKKKKTCYIWGQIDLPVSATNVAIVTHKHIFLLTPFKVEVMLTFMERRIKGNREARKWREGGGALLNRKAITTNINWAIPQWKSIF